LARVVWPRLEIFHPDLAWAEIAFAPLAILAGPIAGYWDAAETVNNILVVAAGVVILGHLFGRRGAGSTLLRCSIVVFFALVLFNNLHLTIAGRNLEPYGFLALIVGLAYTAARRAILREEKLVEVENELATARRIQASILPRALPEMEGVRFAAPYRPMAQVAGDFYDALRLDESRVSVFIADVSGHGVPAALIASMLKVAFAQAPGIRWCGGARARSWNWRKTACCSAPSATLLTPISAFRSSAATGCCSIPTASWKRLPAMAHPSASNASANSSPGCAR